MGVMYEYFRAADVDAVAHLMKTAGGGPLVQRGRPPAADAVGTKGIDPAVVLGKLVALALGVAWTADLVDDKLVWPEGVAQDLEYEGPWITVLDGRTRDRLDSITDDRLPELANRWSDIEELAGYGETDSYRMLTLLKDLVGLARRARAAEENLYCWISL